MQCVAAKPDLLPWDNNVGAAVRGLEISELFAFMLRCAVRKNRQSESVKNNYRKADICIAVSFRWVFEMCSCFCLWHCMALGLQAWLAQSRAYVQLRLGFRGLQGGEFPGKKRSVTALRASSWQVGFLASHPIPKIILLGFHFVLVCFMPRLFVVKYMNTPGRVPHKQLRALTMGWLCKGQGIPTCVCLQLGENKPRALTLLRRLWAWRGWRHFPSCSNSGVFGTPVGWHFTHISAQHSLSTSGTTWDTTLSSLLWAGTVGAVSQWIPSQGFNNCKGGDSITSLSNFLQCLVTHCIPGHL